MFVSVDLPIPGEPPSSTSEPGTRPPPSTRSSSPIPVDIRRTGATPISLSRRGARRCARAEPLRAPGPRAARRAWPCPRAGRRGSSTSAFQASQPGHCPCHCGAWKPHWTYVRPDLPRTLQVGIDAFSGDNSPAADMIDRVDWFRFAPPGVSARAANAKILRALTRD